MPFLSSPPRNAFLSSIFHLFPSFYLIIIYLPWWKIAFSARLSSTFIFHLPPSAIAWKSFLIPSYSELYFLFLVSFPFKKHFHIPACLLENVLLFSGSPLLFAAWDILCPRPPHSLSAIPFLPPSWIDGASLYLVLLLSFHRRFPSSMVCPKNALPWRCLYARTPVTLNAGSIYQPG